MIIPQPADATDKLKERGEKNMAAGQRSNQILVPQARAGLDQMKYEIAAQIGLPNYQGYLGDVPSKLNGAVGGNMVRKMIEAYEAGLAGRK
jgi:hypothetical protein